MKILIIIALIIGIATMLVIGFALYTWFSIERELNRKTKYYNQRNKRISDKFYNAKK